MGKNTSSVSRQGARGASGAGAAELDAGEADQARDLVVLPWAASWVVSGGASWAA